MAERRVHGSPEYAGCERHKSCWRWGHCVCGGKANGPDGKCVTCKYGACECGNKANGPEGKCNICRYGACECGNKANGPDGKCSTCRYGACECGNKAGYPDGKCTACKYGSETCDVPGCRNSCSRPGLCEGHYARQHSHGDVFADIPLGSKIRINGTVVGTDKTYLYVCYDATGIPIYVGISVNWKNRVSQHRSDKPWWHLVASIEYVSFPTRAAADAKETELIKKFQPEYNTAKK